MTEADSNNYFSSDKFIQLAPMYSDENYLLEDIDGDGLMIIRKLFGSSFDGSKLTDKAISNDATRTTDEIHEYIAAMSTVDTIA